MMVDMTATVTTFTIMTGAELQTAIKALGMSQRAFARLINYREETISRWVREHEPIPQVVNVAVSAMLAEIGKHPGRRVPRGTGG